MVTAHPIYHGPDNGTAIEGKAANQDDTSFQIKDHRVLVETYLQKESIVGGSRLPQKPGNRGNPLDIQDLRIESMGMQLRQIFGNVCPLDRGGKDFASIRQVNHRQIDHQVLHWKRNPCLKFKNKGLSNLFPVPERHSEIPE